MKTLLLVLPLTFAVSAVRAADPVLPDFNSKTLALPSLSLKEVLNELELAPAKPPQAPLVQPRPTLPTPEPRVSRESGMPILRPDPNVDYKMIVKAPDPAIDFKMIVRSPDSEAAR
jgi:hypothetical protein